MLYFISADNEKHIVDAWLAAEYDEKLDDNIINR